MPEYFESAEGRKVWNEYQKEFKRADDTIARHAKSLGGAVIANYHEMPGRMIHWSTNGINRQIEIGLGPAPSVTYWVAISASVDRPDGRYLAHNMVLKGCPPAEFLANLSDQLVTWTSLAESWTESELPPTRRYPESTTAISTAAMPLYPGLV